MSSETTMLTNMLQELRAQLEMQGVTGIPRQWFSTEGSYKETERSVFETGRSVIKEEQALSKQRVLEGSKEGEQHKAPASLIVKANDDGYRLLEQQALSCTACRLHETRNKVVFGCGNTNSPAIAFVGEGPGADEDRVGEPFVGKAGALLTAAITKGLQLRREDVYICNVVKCRPPQNRNPMEDEVQSCISFLEQQLLLVAPKVIVALGSPACKALTNSTEGITKSRGRWMSWRGIDVMPTFHPAYILRNPAAKRDFWNDLQEVAQRVGLST